MTVQDSRLRLADAIDRLTAVAITQGETTVARQLSTLGVRVRDQKFYLAVAGQFKRGKSTAINALLGMPILPTDVLPLTSVATHVVSGPDLTVTATFQDGRVESIAPEQLDQFATELGNPGNVRGVDYLVVTLPHPFLVPGLNLVDLPGVGSTVDENSDVAFHAIHQMDAALFVIGADPPVTREELAYLQYLVRRVPRVFVVQNKRDLFSADEWAKALAFNERAISSVLSTPVLSVSAKMALQAKLAGDMDSLARSGWLELEQALTRFLEEDRYRVWVTSLAAKVREAVTPAFEALAIREAASLLPLEQLRARHDLLRARQAELAQGREDMLALFQRDLERQKATMNERLDTWAARAAPLLAEIVPRKVKGLSRADWDAALVTSVWEMATELLADEEERWLAWWEQETESLLAGGNRMRIGLQDAYQELFGVRWDGVGTMKPPRITLQFRLTDLDRQSFFPEVSWSLFTGVMPPKVARRMLMRRLLGRLPQVVDQFRGRVRQTVVQVMESAGRQFLKELNQSLDELEGHYRSALERAASERDLTKNDQDRLQAQLAQARAEWTAALAEWDESVSAGAPLASTVQP
jgi:hypothetical protein